MGMSLQRHAVSSSVLAIACCLGHIGYAGADVAPPARYQKDRNGVDLARGTYSGRVKMLSIGSGNEELPLYLDHRNGRPGTSEYELGIYGDTTSVNVGVLGPNGPASTVFAKVNGVWVSKLGDGATLTQSGTGYVLTLSDGTQYSYDGTLTSVDSNRIARVTSVKYASGRILTMSYLRQVGCSNQNQQQCGGGSNVPWKVRLISVASSSGYQLHFDYATTIAGDSSWNTLTTITAFNMATDACGVTAYSCSFSQNWPAITVAAGAAAGSWTITDNIGRATTFTTTSIRRPGSTIDDLSVTYPSSGYGNVVSVTAAGQTWQYSYSGTYPLTTVTIGNPDGTSRIVTSNVTVGLPTQVTDESGAVTSYTYDSSGRLSTATSPTQVQQRYSYDGRGNVIESRMVSATSGTPADIVTSAGYDPSCANTITCNQPNWTRDAKNAQTDYVYDPTHGGVTSVTLPANPSGVRPQRRYAYSQLQAYYKNSSGTLVASGAPTYLLTSVSECRSSSSCVNSADESRTIIAYGQPGVANNLLPTSTTVSAGDGSVAATTSVAYNGAGDVVSVDGPIPGSADTIRSIYDAARQTTMVVGADPDGAGPQRSRATSYSYDSKGRATGAVIGTANADGSSFTAVQTVSFGYDAADRKLLASLSTGGTTIAVAQYAYDAMGRTICTATRMNAGAFQSPPDGCTLGTPGGNGADRIVRQSYDVARRTVAVTRGYGTDVAATESSAYTASGQLSSVTDANNNVTTYSYDGLDRPTTVTYPGGSNDQVTYDANGNVISRRLRDGQTLTYDYDALNRRVFDHNPKTNVAEVDVGYSYDLLGRLTSAGDGNGWTKNFGYDALGRATTQSSNVASTTLQYDAAGRKTRQTWGDGFYVTYEYNAAGQMTVIRENGGLALATFAYDDLGRRTSLTRGNGTVTSYGYDGASRLTSLTQDLAGTAWDQTYGFTYNAAGQILTRSSSNDSYAWTGAANVDRSYAVNGLNQYTSAGGTTFGYDARGNLTNSGGTTYQYNSRNQLFMNAAGQLIYRNPAGELGQTPAGNFDWVDGQLAQESSSAILRRYVYGPNPDEVLVWYEGAGTGDRRYLHADERGSVVAVSNDAGNAIAINSYDEYGIPGANNQGRFQYTGQAWLPELGMYDYKARMYSPTLGRFMQTDPIGYADGVNWYNYGGGDPVNRTDPSGLQAGVLQITMDPTSPSLGPKLPSTYPNSEPNGVGHFQPRPVDGASKSWLQQIGLWPTPRDTAPQKTLSKPCSPSDRQLANSGRVTFRFAEGSATLLATSGDAWGIFQTAGGYSGTFHVSFNGAIVGVKGLGTAYGRGSSQSLATFKGVNYNIVGAFGPYAFSDNFDPSSGAHVGDTDAAATIGVGLGVTRSNTELLTLSCPR